MKVILFSCIKELFRRKKYIKTILSNYTPLEDSQHLLQRLSRETNSDINTSRLCSTYNQANNQVFL